jgi:hypothetical protein
MPKALPVPATSAGPAEPVRVPALVIEAKTVPLLLSDRCCSEIALDPEMAPVPLMLIWRYSDG